MDRPTYREAIEVKPRNLDRKDLCQAAVEKVLSSYREDRSKVFQGRRNTQDECNKIAYSNKHPSNMLGTQTHLKL